MGPLEAIVFGLDRADQDGVQTTAESQWTKQSNDRAFVIERMPRG